MLFLIGGCKDKTTEMCEDDRGCGGNMVKIDCKCKCIDENYSRIGPSCIGPSPDYYWVQSGLACLDSFGFWITQDDLKNAIEKKENKVHVEQTFGFNNPSYLGGSSSHFAFYEDWSAEWGTHYVLHQNTGFFQSLIEDGVYWACPEYHHYDDYDMDIVFKNKDLSTAYVYIHFWHNVSPYPGTRSKKYGEIIEATFKNNSKTIPLK